MNIGGIKMSSGSATSRLFYDNVVVNFNQNYKSMQSLLQTKYPVDANCPFFYCFTNCAVDTDNKGMALLTKFTFQQGGTTRSVNSMYWGDDATLDTNLSSPIVSVQVAGSGTVYTLGHDPVSGLCGYSVPGSDNFGIATRWSSLADTVIVETFWLFKGQYTGQSQSIIHGILQQPWS